MSPLLTIQDLFFGYDKAPILEKVTLTIQEGEFLALFGPNGGGKTTFLHLLLGFLKPSRGKLMGKQELSSYIGYVPQANRYDKRFPISVLEVVLSGGLSQGYWWGGLPKHLREKAQALLSRLALLSKQNRPFGSLSGGEAQRALLARALINDPQLLLLDEPTASVDAQTEQEIHKLLQELKGKMTILMVTHDLQPVLQIADRLLYINRQVTSLLPQDVCAHFALGLYHPPLHSKQPSL